LSRPSESCRSQVSNSADDGSVISEQRPPHRWHYRNGCIDRREHAVSRRNGEEGSHGLLTPIAACVTQIRQRLALASPQGFEHEVKSILKLTTAAGREQQRNASLDRGDDGAGVAVGIEGRRGALHRRDPGC
jgi:hypothetical protein